MKKSFDGTKEAGTRPVRPNGDELMRQLEGVESLFGHSMGKRPRTDSSINEEKSIWKK
jgi:hypothetical protein